MAQKTKRKRRATLRGWWKTLPFLICPVLLFMTFANLEASRLRNQYHRIELVDKEQALRKDISQLQDLDREMNRIEIMDEKAPNWELRDPDPDQIVIVPSDSISKSIDEIHAYQSGIQQERLPTRTVLLHVTYEDNILAEASGADELLNTDRERMAYEARKTD